MTRRKAKRVALWFAVAAALVMAAAYPVQATAVASVAAVVVAARGRQSGTGL